MSRIKTVVLYNDKGRRVAYEGRHWTVKLVNLKCGCTQLVLKGVRGIPLPKPRRKS